MRHGGRNIPTDEAAGKGRNTQQWVSGMPTHKVRNAPWQAHKAPTNGHGARSKK